MARHPSKINKILYLSIPWEFNLVYWVTADVLYVILIKLSVSDIHHVVPVVLLSSSYYYFYDVASCYIFFSICPEHRYFWDVVLGFSLDLQKKLLHFATGSDRVPVGGMADLNFKISKSETSTNW